MTAVTAMGDEGFLPPIRPLPLHGVTPAPGLGPAPQPDGGFSAWFAQQLQHVNGQLQMADQQLQGLATGESQSLHRVMISLEEARLSFQLALQVRNRVLEAYQDVMRMQI